MFAKKWQIILYYLLNLEQFYADTVLIYGLSKCKDLFLYILNNKFEHIKFTSIILIVS